MNDQMTSKKIVFSAILASLAIIFGLIEGMLPSPTNFVLGAKLGLTNIVILIALYTLDVKTALKINLVRVTLVALLLGSFSSFYYSLAGAMLSLFAMCLVKHLGQEKVSIIGVSVMGSLFHHLGQLAMASIFSKTWMIFNYLPILSLVGILTGVLTGVLAHLLLGYLAHTSILPLNHL